MRERPSALRETATASRRRTRAVALPACQAASPRSLRAKPVAARSPLPVPRSTSTNPRRARRVAPQNAASKAVSAARRQAPLLSSSRERSSRLSSARHDGAGRELTSLPSCHQPHGVQRSRAHQLGSRRVERSKSPCESSRPERTARPRGFACSTSTGSSTAIRTLVRECAAYRAALARRAFTERFLVGRSPRLADSGTGSSKYCSTGSRTVCPARSTGSVSGGIPIFVLRV